MAQPVFAAAYDFVNFQLDVFLNARLSSVQSAVTSPLRLTLVLYVTLYGIAVIRGAIQEPVMDGVNRGIKLLFIYMVATTAAYGTYVTVPLFTTFPNFLAAAISGGSAQTIGQGFDEFMFRGIDLGNEAMKGANPVIDFAPYLYGLLVIAMAVIVAGFGFAIMLVSLVTLAILVALGPIFIAFLVFEPTRRYFFSWLNQGVTSLATFTIIITVFELIKSLVASQWDAISGAADPEIGCLLYCAYAVLGGLFFLHVPTLAAGLAGGVGSAARDFVNAGAQVASAVASRGASAPALAAGGGRGAAAGGSISAASGRAQIPQGTPAR